jgi:hypothetical protein
MLNQKSVYFYPGGFFAAHHMKKRWANSNYKTHNSVKIRLFINGFLRDNHNICSFKKFASNFKMPKGLYKNWLDIFFLKKSGSKKASFCRLKKGG